MNCNCDLKENLCIFFEAQFKLKFFSSSSANSVNYILFLNKNNFIILQANSRILGLNIDRTFGIWPSTKKTIHCISTWYCYHVEPFYNYVWNISRKHLEVIRKLVFKSCLNSKFEYVSKYFHSPEIDKRGDYPLCAVLSIFTNLWYPLYIKYYNEIYNNNRRGIILHERNVENW